VDVFALFFFQVLYTVFVRRGSEDRLWWVSSKRGLFKVKSFFSSLASSEGSCFFWKSVTDSGSFESGFFCVLTVLDKILTLDNLRKKQVIMVNRCCMLSEESVDHLLHCDVASALWSALFTCFGLSLVMPSSVINLFAAIWKMMPICHFWCLWKEKKIGVSRIWRDPWRIFLTLFFVVCIFGQWLLYPHCRLVLGLSRLLPRLMKGLLAR
jgi:hypothetical protein